MKIIQIASYYPPHLGGMEQRIRDLSEKIAKKGHQVEVFTSDMGCPKETQLKSKKNLNINYLTYWELANTPATPSLFFKLLKLPKGSIIHVHVAQAFFPEIVWLISKLKKLPYVSHLRGDVIPSSLIGRIILTPYKKLFLKKVLKDSDKIIALNEDYKNLISEKYNVSKEKIVVIPNATDFKIIEDLKQKSKNKNITLLFVGRFSYEKNIDFIIKGLSLLKNKKFKFYLAGDGEDRQKLIDLVKEKRLEKQVIFLGSLDRKKLYNQYLNSDILLLPSKTECFSSTLLEAMATGTTIIASDILGTRNVVKNNYNGLLVEPTPKKIAEAIEKLIKNPKLREKLARNGLKEVKKYSWNKIVSQTEQVYKEVLKQHATHKK